MRKGLRSLVLVGVASALLAGCGGQAPKPEPKPLRLIVTGLPDGGVVEGSTELCVKVENASQPLTARIESSLSGPPGLRDAYERYGVPPPELESSSTITIPANGLCQYVLFKPNHSGVHTIIVSVPEKGLEESFSVEFDEPQFKVYGWTDGVTVPPGTELPLKIVWEIGEPAVRGEIYRDGTLSVVADPYSLDTSFALPSGKKIFMKDGGVWSTSSGARLDVYLKRRDTLEELWHGYWYTSD